MKKLKALLLLPLLLVLTFSGCAPSEKKMTDEELIGRMITEYGTEARSPEETLKQLKKQSPEKGETWQNIMDYWAYANTSMPIRYDLLPDNLDIDGRLAIVVLGYQLAPNGEMRPELLGRLTTAMNCAQQYPDSYIVCTGGGTASGNPDATEAGSMAAWLAELGIDPARIIVEDQSMTTAQNAQFTHAILSEQYPDVTAIAIVSSDYHIPWASTLFQTEALLLGEGHPQVIAHAALQTGETETYMRYQVMHIRVLAGVE